MDDIHSLVTRKASQLDQLTEMESNDLILVARGDQTFRVPAEFLIEHTDVGPLRKLLRPVGSDAAVPQIWLFKGQSNTQPRGPLVDPTIPENVWYIAQHEDGTTLTPFRQFTTFDDDYFQNRYSIAIATAQEWRKDPRNPVDQPIIIVIIAQGGQSLEKFVSVTYNDGVPEFDCTTAPFTQNLLTAVNTVKAALGLASLTFDKVTTLQGERDSDSTDPTKFLDPDLWADGNDFLLSYLGDHGLIGSATILLHAELAQWQFSVGYNLPDANARVYRWAFRRTNVFPFQRAMISSAGLTPNTPTAADANHYSSASRQKMAAEIIAKYRQMAAFGGGSSAPGRVDVYGQPVIWDRIVPIGNMGFADLLIHDGGTGYANAGTGRLKGGVSGNGLDEDFDHQCKISYTAVGGVINTVTIVDAGRYAVFPPNYISIITDDGVGAGAQLAWNGTVTDSATAPIVYMAADNLANLERIETSGACKVVIPNGTGMVGASHVTIYHNLAGGGIARIYCREPIWGPTGIACTNQEYIPSIYTGEGDYLHYYIDLEWKGEIVLSNDPDGWRVYYKTNVYKSLTADAAYTVQWHEYSLPNEPGVILRTSNNALTILPPDQAFYEQPSAVKIQQLSGPVSMAMSDGSANKCLLAPPIGALAALTANTFTFNRLFIPFEIYCDGSRWIASEDRGLIRQNLTVGDDASLVSFSAVNAGAGASKTNRWLTASALRGSIGVGAAGRIQLSRYDVTGTFQSNPLDVSDTTGEVGINTAPVAGQMLTVGGNIGTTGNGVNTVGTDSARFAAMFSRRLALNAVRSSVSNGFAVTMADTTAIQNVAPGGSVATGSVMCKATPYGGEICEFYIENPVTTFTLNPNTGQTVVGAPTTITKATRIRLHYNSVSAAWYCSISA